MPTCSIHTEILFMSGVEQFWWCCILWMTLYLCVVLGHYKAETSAACCVAGSSIYNDQGSFSFLLEHRSSSVRRSSGRHPQHHSSSKTTMDLPHTLMIKNDNRSWSFLGLVLVTRARTATCPWLEVPCSNLAKAEVICGCHPQHHSSSKPPTSYT